MKINFDTKKIKFVRVCCNKCSKDQILFTRASRRVKCFECGEILAVPTGGKCELTKCRCIEELR